MKELKDDLLKTLGDRMAPAGYRLRKSSRSFIKTVQGGRRSLHLAFIDHEGDFDIKADVGIRLDDVEDMVNAQNKNLTKSQKGNTYTIGVELGNLSQGAPMRWTISSKSDVESVAGGVFAFFQKVGEPYFEEFASREQILKLLSSDEREVWKHSPIDGMRAKKAIALAVILNKPADEIEDLANTKKAYLQGKQDFGTKDFIRFCDELLPRKGD